MAGTAKKDGKPGKKATADPQPEQPAEGRSKKAGDKESDSPLKSSDKRSVDKPLGKTPKGPKSGKKGGGGGGGGPRGGPAAVDSFDSKQHIPPNVVVAVGDQIHVFYHRNKTYEAKVIKVKEPGQGEEWPKFLVHYTGWNVRYDEWIPRSR